MFFNARTLSLVPSRNSDARSVMLRIPLPSAAHSGAYIPEYADGTLKKPTANRGPIPLSLSLFCPFTRHPCEASPPAKSAKSASRGTECHGVRDARSLQDGGARGNHAASALQDRQSLCQKRDQRGSKSPMRPQFTRRNLDNLSMQS